MNPLSNHYTLEEQQLVEDCIGGNSRAQLRLYRKYVKAMYNTVVRMVPEPMDAEDVVQDLFVKVFKNLRYFKGESSLGAWIKRIAINTALNFLRKSKNIRYVDLETHRDVYEPLEEAPTFWDMKAIHFAIKELPEGCRVVFNLYLLEGYQHKEIAQMLEITESTSKTQYRRAKILLKEKLKSPIKTL